MRNQRGSTLAIVLIMLLLMMLLGTWAIRQSLTSLKTATNSQAQQILMHASDAIFYRLGLGGYIDDMDQPLSLLGYALEHQGSEVVFCFRAQQATFGFDVTQSSLIRWTEDGLNYSVDGQSGFCSINNSLDYASSRKAQLTQISVQVELDKTAEINDPLAYLSLGRDDGDSENLVENNKNIVVVATSFIPGLAINTQDNEIEKCLRKTQIKNTKSSNQTLSECLRNAGVPFNTQIQNLTLNLQEKAISSETSL